MKWSIVPKHRFLRRLLTFSHIKHPGPLVSGTWSRFSEIPTTSRTPPTRTLPGTPLGGTTGGGSPPTTTGREKDAKTKTKKAKANSHTPTGRRILEFFIFCHIWFLMCQNWPRRTLRLAQDPQISIPQI